MEELRWILLGVGIVIIVAIYFWGKKRKRDADYSTYVIDDGVPPFSAEDGADNEWLDGVGPVRVVKRFNDAEMDTFDFKESMDSDVSESMDETVQVNDVESVPVAEAVHVEYEQPDLQIDDKEIENTEIEGQEEERVTEEAVSEQSPVPVDDVVALYLVAERGNELKGEQILSATYATQLEYGQMNIFHRKDANGKIIFSMSNMMEPGSFNIHEMNDMTTRGMSLFIQLSLCDDPVQALDDMLICSHSLSKLLNTQICDQHRQLLNEAFTKSLREKAKGFASQ